MPVKGTYQKYIKFKVRILKSEKRNKRIIQKNNYGKCLKLW